MRIATWNVNSVRQRLPHLLAYLKEVQPDVLCLQEIESLDDSFRGWRSRSSAPTSSPMGRRRSTASPFSPSGLSRSRTACRRRERFPVALYRGGRPGRRRRGTGGVRLSSERQSRGSEKYPYKLAFLERLIIHTRELLEYEEPLVLAGDFNVIPDARDATRPEDWVNDALSCLGRAPSSASCARPDRRAPRDHRRRRPLHLLGLSGGRLAEEQRHPHRPSLLSPEAADKLQSVTIDKEMRGRDKASDHTPVRVDWRRERRLPSRERR